MQQTELRRPPAARNGQLAASEVSEFTDSITGCAVRQLTGAALRSVHSYYDIPPWSPTSGQIAFTRLAAEGSGGDICIMERDGSDLRTVAQTREVTPNDGAYPQWSADGERVYIEVGADGTVTEHAGFITEKEHRSRERRKANDGDEDGNAGAASRPELTKAAQNYLDLHRHAAEGGHRRERQGVQGRSPVRRGTQGGPRPSRPARARPFGGALERRRRTHHRQPSPRSRNSKTKT